MNKVDIEGVIGWEVTARSVKEQLAEYRDSDDITVTINSPGGFVDEGFSIYTALKNRAGNVHMHITGIAASMGSVIAMAGDTITMEETGIAMIHPPAGMCWGTAVDMRKEADVLDKYESRLVKAYDSRELNLSSEELSNAIAETTWYTAEEFLAAGFIDSITDEQSAANPPQNRAALEWLRAAQYKNIPEAATRFFNQSCAPINAGGSAINPSQKGVKDVSDELNKLKAELEKVTAERDAAIDAEKKATNRADALQAMVGHKNASPESIRRAMAMGLDAEQVAVFMDGEKPPQAVAAAPEGKAARQADAGGRNLMAATAGSEDNPAAPIDDTEVENAGKTNERDSFSAAAARRMARKGLTSVQGGKS